ncbi:thioredoxin-like protein CXXS2 [Galendromus occidentalis]|uniref:Thioredoxin-like protein CXXS2 n=1 Tax=Galendromus occidentalis TaxID=34638 RepID=A0AAJ6QT44_9ACAR|nr:thioredoxin-like protein CXXS2 [Galendromus occidentalis]
MAVIVPSDFEDFYRLINTPGKVIFVLMYAWWCWGSQNAMPTFGELSDEFKDCLFIKVEMEEIPDVPRIYDLDSTPALMFFRNGGRADTCLGGDRERLEQFIRMWAC